MSEATTVIHNKADRMLGLLQRQSALYGKLEVLAEKQRSLVASEDTDPLLRLLAQRQKLTVELAALGVEMKQLTPEWPSIRGALAGDLRDEADRLISESNDRLASLLEADERDAQMLKMRKVRVGEELTNVRSKRQAMVAYGRSGASNEPRFERLSDES